MITFSKTFYKKDNEDRMNEKKRKQNVINIASLDTIVSLF